MQHRAEPTCAAFTSTSAPSKLFQRQNKLLPVLGPKQGKKELKLDASSARLNTWNSLTLGPEAALLLLQRSIICSKAERSEFQTLETAGLCTQSPPTYLLLLIPVIHQKVSFNMQEVHSKKKKWPKKKRLCDHRGSVPDGLSHI